ncbi:TetR/AcrR family transcriptional regulator [Streptomyces sp. NBC_01280]|uniref:TetR/AcrR family transcriptional regulator n=1 Tax=Streptomyces sp. NBC_01280 TaxID=2903810 RepID=UPI002E361AEB|nr:helix-turn-helix domain-containing protein [Streptomyces sp. NBC_01280]
MDPEQRRAAIVAAALPLVIEYGASVTTAKVARAAGIGEGTIFRVFDDKNALLAACMAEAARPDTTVAHLESISMDQPLADRLAEAADTMRGHMTRMGAVAGALAASGRLERPAPPSRKRTGASRTARPVSPPLAPLWPPCSSPSRTVCGWRRNASRTPSRWCSWREAERALPTR